MLWGEVSSVPTCLCICIGIGIRLGLCTHSNRLDRRSISHANAPGRVRLGATSCKLTRLAEQAEEGNGNWASWLVRVLCLLWFRVELGVVWGGRICLGAGWRSVWVRGRG